jgi:expansin (peptidoglycan-binding protein)
MRFSPFKLCLIITFSVSSLLFAVPDNGSITHNGTITYYDDGLLGHCSYPLADRANYQYHAAINTSDYDNSFACGAWIEATGPRGTIQLMVDNECPVATNPKCVAGHLDLNPAAFEQLDDPVLGYVPITWKYIAHPNLTGPVVFQFKEGSNQWHLEVLVKNHRYPITKLEIQTGTGQWLDIPRQSYNYFQLIGGMGVGPFTFRVTDIHGQQIVNANVPGNLSSQLTVPQIVQGSGQFPVVGSGSSSSTTNSSSSLSSSSAPSSSSIQISSSQSSSSVSPSSSSQQNPTGNLLDYYLVPSSSPLPTLGRAFEDINTYGVGAPDLSIIAKWSINWNLPNNGLYDFSINTNNGQPSWYIPLNNSTQSFAQANPDLTLAGTGITGLDGNYWVRAESNGIVLVEKSGDYAIVIGSINQTGTMSSSIPSSSSSAALSSSAPSSSSALSSSSAPLSSSQISSSSNPVISSSSNPSSDLLSLYNLPAGEALPDINRQFTLIQTSGNAPDLSNVSQWDVNWNASNQALYSFAFNTNNGSPGWYINLNGSVQTFDQPNPSITISGSGISGLDGTYYVGVQANAMVLVTTSGDRAIVFGDYPTESSSSTLSSSSSQGSSSSTEGPVQNLSANKLNLLNLTVDKQGLQFDVVQNQVFNLKVYDLLGNLIHIHQGQAFAGQNRVYHGVAHRGVYIAELKTSSAKAAIRFEIR